MLLTFIYHPVRDLDEAVAYYRDRLGWEEAWREADDTVALALPGSETQLMISTDPQPAGPMYRVDDLDAWLAEHSELELVVTPYEIPGGTVAGVGGPGGNVFYVFDLPGV
ncbi:VOC family protein [Cellulomonas sp. Marseille-Q8402]